MSLFIFPSSEPFLRTLWSLQPHAAGAIAVLFPHKGHHGSVRTQPQHDQHRALPLVLVGIQIASRLGTLGTLGTIFPPRLLSRTGRGRTGGLGRWKSEAGAHRGGAVSSTWVAQGHAAVGGSGNSGGAQTQPSIDQTICSRTDGNRVGKIDKGSPGVCSSGAVSIAKSVEPIAVCKHSREPHVRDVGLATAVIVVMGGGRGGGGRRLACRTRCCIILEVIKNRKWTLTQDHTGEQRDLSIYLFMHR